MASVQDFEVPDFDELLGGMLKRVDDQRQPLLLALLERVAAAQYREWAALPDYRAHQAALQGCAAREEAIANRVEGLYPNAQALQTDIRAEMPELAQVPDELFGGRSVPHQMAVLAVGERAGGRMWEMLATAAPTDQAREVMASCVSDEDENASALEAILRER